MRIYLIIIAVFLTSCTAAFDDRQTIDIEDISYADILRQFDTVPLRLTNDQVAEFVHKWNYSIPKGPLIYLPRYFLTIHFGNDSILLFRINGNMVKQESDWAYSVGDKDYFDKLWYKLAGLSDNWFEYVPTYKIEGKYAKWGDMPNEKVNSAIKKVFTYYHHEWKDIRGQVFYEGRISDELLSDYTQKATDSIWLIFHK